jgi:hypothetical protein
MFRIQRETTMSTSVRGGMRLRIRSLIDLTKFEFPTPGTVGEQIKPQAWWSEVRPDVAVVLIVGAAALMTMSI